MRARRANRLFVRLRQDVIPLNAVLSSFRGVVCGDRRAPGCDGSLALKCASTRTVRRVATERIERIDGTLTIAEASELTGLSPSTLRYYERIGLIDGVERGPDGRRRYQAADLAWMAFLLRLRTTGMPIQGMLAFAGLSRGGDATVRARLELLRRHQAQVRREYEAVMRSLDAIDNKIAHYERLVEERDGDNRREA